MHRTWVSGVVGMAMMLAACTAQPATTSTTNPQQTQPPVTSTTDSGRATAGQADGSLPETVGSEVVEHDTTPDDAGSTSASERDPLEAVEDSPAVGGGETEPEEAPPDETTTTSTTTTTNAGPAEGLDDLIDEVDALLNDLETILGDLDADLTSVGDGLNMTEGDI